MSDDFLRSQQARGASDFNDVFMMLRVHTKRLWRSVMVEVPVNPRSQREDGLSVIFE